MWSLFTRAAAGSFITRILLALGVGFLSYAGFAEVLSLAQTQIQTYLTGFSADAVGFLGLCNLDHIVNAIFAGYSAQIALSAPKKLLMK